MIRLLLAELHTGLHKAIYLSHTSVGVQEFYSHIAAALGLETTGRRTTLYRAIQQRVLSLHKQSRIHTALEPLANSITVSLAIDGLPKDETFSYIESRISACGGHTGMFTQSALSLIHQASIGVLHSVGTIDTAAMMKAYHGDSPVVEGEHVQAFLTR